MRRKFVADKLLSCRAKLFAKDGIIQKEELELSISEMMDNLQLAGISCAGSVDLDRDLPADTAMRLFDFYEYVVEHAFDGLSAFLARFFCRDGCYFACVDAVCSLDLTALRTEQISVSETEEHCYTISLSLEGGDGRC